jgi:heterodisulfide reductase subunit A
MTNEAKKTDAVVIGGGIAGISAALELARLGRAVALVEKTPFFGGRAAHLCCKATDICQKCGACLVEERLRALFQEPRITLYPQTEVTGLTRDNGRFHLVLTQQPLVINSERCVDCGLCLEECPAAAQGAILTTTITQNHPRFAVNPEACLYFQDGSCRVCQQICPPTAHAIDLERPAMTIDLDAGTLIVATGHQPADPASRPHYGYGRHPQLVSAAELEDSLRNGLELTGQNGEPLRVAFIQCVGSRDRQHPYCSQVCCGYTLRLARLLKHEQPDAEITSFYMDLQNVGRDACRFEAAARQEIQVVRALPGDLRKTPDGRVKLRYLDDQSGKPQEAPFDLVVLAVGIGPGADNAALAALLNVELTEQGFFRAADPRHRSQTSQPGLFLAGTAEGPRDIAGSITQAVAAARQASEYMKES